MIGAAVGAAYLTAKDFSDSDTSDDIFDPESDMDDSERKFKLLMKYPDGTIEEEDELFDSEEAAEEYGEYMMACSREGAETLFLSNPGDYPLEDYEEPCYEIVET